MKLTILTRYRMKISTGLKRLLSHIGLKAKYTRHCELWHTRLNLFNIPNYFYSYTFNPKIIILNRAYYADLVTSNNTLELYFINRPHPAPIYKG